MMNLNTPIWLPPSIKLYNAIHIGLLCFIVSIPIAPPWVERFLILVIFFGLPYYVFLVMAYNAFTFIFDENKITINEGIIIKNSKSISFNVIQSIENVSGISYRIFGLSKMSIWTSSPEQIKGHKPDLVLVLSTNDANWFKNFILDKKSK